MKKVFQSLPPEPEYCPTNFFKPMPDGSVTVVQEFVVDSDFSSYEIDTLLANGVNVSQQVPFIQSASVDTVAAIEDNLVKNVESFKSESK